MNKEEIVQALGNGYKEFLSGNTKAAAKIWLPVWKSAQDLMIQKGFKSEKEIIGLFGHDFLNWFFDLDIALMESNLHDERIEFNRYLLTIADYMDQDNPRLNIAEGLAALDRYDEAESILSGWLEEDPLWTGGWTCRANIMLDKGKGEKAYEIIERGMATIESSDKNIDLRLFYGNAEAVYRRLGKADRADYCAGKDREMSSKAKPKQMDITSTPKAGRNDPCPCGSGKKYKKCCGNK